jgi:hypothetical protein
MSLSDLIKNAVATAKSVTVDIQPTITLESYLRDDEYGNRLFNASATYQVILEKRTRFITVADQQLQASQCNIQFLEAVQVKAQDRITLPDGTAPQILSIEGAADEDGLYFAPKVYF